MADGTSRRILVTGAPSKREICPKISLGPSLLTGKIIRYSTAFYKRVLPKTGFTASLAPSAIFRWNFQKST